MASQSFPLAAYAFDGLAFVPSSGGAADGSPSEQKTQINAFNHYGLFCVRGSDADILRRRIPLP
jgi:hypothetical protein